MFAEPPYFKTVKPQHCDRDWLTGALDLEKPYTLLSDDPQTRVYVRSNNWLNGLNRVCAWGILCFFLFFFSFSFWSCCAWRLSAPSLPPRPRVTVMDGWLTIQAFNNCNLLPDEITFSPVNNRSRSPPVFKEITLLLLLVGWEIKATFPFFGLGNSSCGQVFHHFWSAALCFFFKKT